MTIRPPLESTKSGLHSKLIVIARHNNMENSCLGPKLESLKSGSV